MRPMVVWFLLAAGCGTALAQATPQDAALLARTRALYDAPFARKLAGFDCEVQFNWNQHFVDEMGSVPSAAEPTIEQMEAIQHRVSMSRAGATVSDVGTAPDFDSIPMGGAFEQALREMIPAGLNEWLPFASDEILPGAKTDYSFRKTDAGYTVEMRGKDMAATLYLGPDLRLMRGESRLPQPTQFTTDYVQGPQGFLLRSVQTEVPGRKAEHVPTVTYTYQGVQGVEIPEQVTVTTGIGEVWKYRLTGCEVR